MFSKVSEAHGMVYLSSNNLMIIKNPQSNKCICGLDPALRNDFILSSMHYPSF